MAEIDRVHDRVYRIPCPFEGGGIVNLYVIRGAKTAIVDSGVLGTPTNDVAPALATVGLKLSDIDLLINSHGHMDHLGGNGELKDAGAEIAIHSADAPRTKSNRLHVEKSAEGLKALGLEHTLPAREAFLLKLLGKEVGVDRVLEDGDVIDLGDDVRLRVVHSPGHTPGSVCYWWEAAGILITGDSIQCRGSRPGGLPVIEDARAYPGTLSRLRDVGARTLFMAHLFRGKDEILGPVARDGKVAEVFAESATTHQTLSEAVRAARAASPGASGGDLARGAVEHARAALGLVDDPSVGLPNSGTTTLPSYLAVGG
ncbi:MAG: MBL fold metallo-hydrolase [Chloroflexota bacterium]